MSEFDKLLAELSATAEQSSTLAKALPADNGEDDKAIQAAAADGDAKEGAEAEEEGEGNPEDADDKPMAKSMTIDGEDVEVLDGEQLLKSIGALGDRLNTNEQMLLKALEATNGALQKQNDLIKSLSQQVETLSGQGRGRKAVLSIVEKKDPTQLAKSEQQAPMITPNEILAKALTAQAAGRLMAMDVSKVEQSLNANLPVPADIMAKLN